MVDSATNHQLWKSLFQTLDRIVFELHEDKLTLLSADIPADIRDIFGNFSRKTIEDRLPFLDAFLMETEEFIKKGEGAGPSSGSWLENGLNGSEYYLEAQIFRFEKTAYLIINNLGERYLKQQAVMQKGRDNLLLNERLSRQIQLREILYHCMAHDIRGPLSEIQLALDILFESDEWTPKQLQMRDIMAQAITREYRLIDNILLAFKEETQAGTPEKLEFSLYDIAESAIESLQGNGSLMAMVTGESFKLYDDIAITRVFYNLLSNAIRHSPANEVICIHLEQDKHSLTVSIMDRGDGIPVGQEKVIFDKFTQNPGQNTGKIGLGLYYCRLVIRRHGGSIEAFNNPSAPGACFRFTIPLC